MKNKQHITGVMQPALVKAFGLFSIVFSSAMLPTSALAANDSSNNKHWSFGSALGDINTDLTADKPTLKPDNPVKVKTINLEENRVGWKLNVGVDVTSNIAIEAGYMDMNKDTEINPVVTDPAIFSNMGNGNPTNAADGFTLGSVYRYNITDQIGLTGSVGVFNWEGDLVNQALNGPAVTNDGKGGTDIYFGLGGGYRLTEDVSLSIEWEHYEFNNDDSDTLSIGVSYHFK